MEVPRSFYEADTLLFEVSATRSVRIAPGALNCAQPSLVRSPEGGFVKIAGREFGFFGKKEAESPRCGYCGYAFYRKITA